MPVIFEGSRLRIERAHAHGKALAQAWNEIPAEDLYTVSAKVNTNGKGSIRLTRPKPSPPILPSTPPPVGESRSYAKRQADRRSASRRSQPRQTYGLSSAELLNSSKSTTCPC